MKEITSKLHLGYMSENRERLSKEIDQISGGMTRKQINELIRRGKKNKDSWFWTLLKIAVGIGAVLILYDKFVSGDF